MKSVRKFVGKIHPLYWGIGFGFMLTTIAIGLGFWYGNIVVNTISKQLISLSSRIESLDVNFASTTVSLEENIAETQSSLSTALEQEKGNVAAIKSQLGNFEEEVGTISGTVDTLEKLSKTDPELLQKYSKVFFLNEHYEPPLIFEVPDKYKYYEEKDFQIRPRVWSYLQEMVDSALLGDIEIYIFSAYRSFGTQEILRGQYTVIYGEESANQFSADQGYSEHQLGTTVDLITTGINGTLSDFETTKAYQWLLNNAHRYGFTLSYPEGNNYYIFEPWHWRFIGVALATDLHNTGKFFYDLEQREIDKYLVSIFD